MTTANALPVYLMQPADSREENVCAACGCTYPRNNTAGCEQPEAASFDMYSRPHAEFGEYVIGTLSAPKGHHIAIVDTGGKVVRLT